MSDPIAELTIPIRVRAKGRPRVGRNGAIYSPTSENERAIAVLLRADFAGRTPIDQDCRAEIELGTDWFTLRIIPLSDHKRELRGDIDNYLKQILDAAQKAGVVRDDRCIREIEIRECAVDFREVSS